MGKAMTKRLLLADDHPIFVEGVIKLLDERADFEVAARVSNGDDAVARLLEGNIDLAVLDISMPGRSGLDVVEAVRASGIECHFVLLTMYNEAEYLDRARELDVAGYVLKECATEELITALDRVLGGEDYVSASMGRRSAPPSTSDTVGQLGELTRVELAVLKELGLNRTSRQIAEVLGVSYRTVQNHRANICSKLGFRGANRLLQFALEHRERL